MSRKQILLSNDDGIDSPGLWAAAEALSALGYVTVTAPLEHMSATGRGHQRHADGSITRKKLTVGGQEWDVFAINGSPSQSVLHGILEVVDQTPDPVVSGINFGENLGTDITYSGTVGAAIEAASLGIPALAMSQQIITNSWDSFPKEVDFSVSAYFTRFFAEKLLTHKMPDDVDLLNVGVPAGATPQTPWKVTRQAKVRYYSPFVVREGDFHGKAKITSHVLKDEDIPLDNDIHTLRIEKKVAVIPISLDLTSRVSFEELENILRG